MSPSEPKQRTEQRAAIPAAPVPSSGREFELTFEGSVNLGIALYTGTGCPRDVEAARALWEEADELGITEAGRCLRNAESGEFENMMTDAE